MTRNPIVNALCAMLYIAGLVSIIFYAGDYIEEVLEFSIFLPMAFLSLFVFSAAAMGYIFLGQPIQMFLSGEKKEAVGLFIKTLAAFGVTVLVVVGGGILLTSTF